MITNEFTHDDSIKKIIASMAILCIVVNYPSNLLIPIKTKPSKWLISYDEPLYKSKWSGVISNIFTTQT